MPIYYYERPWCCSPDSGAFLSDNDVMAKSQMPKYTIFMYKENPDTKNGLPFVTVFKDDTLNADSIVTE